MATERFDKVRMRAMMEAGEPLEVIAEEIGCTLSWIKSCKWMWGMARRVNRIDPGKIYSILNDADLTDAEKTFQLGISLSYLTKLNRKFRADYVHRYAYKAADAPLRRNPLTELNRMKEVLKARRPEIENITEWMKSGEGQAYMESVLIRTGDNPALNQEER